MASQHQRTPAEHDTHVAAVTPGDSGPAHQAIRVLPLIVAVCALGFTIVQYSGLNWIELLPVFVTVTAVAFAGVNIAGRNAGKTVLPNTLTTVLLLSGVAVLTCEEPIVGIGALLGLVLAEAMSLALKKANGHPATDTVAIVDVSELALPLFLRSVIAVITAAGLIFAFAPKSFAGWDKAIVGAVILNMIFELCTYLFFATSRRSDRYQFSAWILVFAFFLEITSILLLLNYPAWGIGMLLGYFVVRSFIVAAHDKNA